MDGLEIRPAAAGDAPVIVAHRRAMFEEMGGAAAEQLDRMDAAFAPWVAVRLATGEYQGWLAVDAAGGVAGGAGVWVMDWPPHMLHVAARRANVLNVYVRPAFRRRGLARRLMQTALDWCRAQGLSVVILHASQAGRPLYEALGFRATNEMRLVLGD